MQLTYGIQSSMVISLQVYEPSLASVLFVQLIKSLWVGRSKIWQNTSCPGSIFTTCSEEEVKVYSKFFDGSNFCSSYFRMQNARAKYTKISTI